MSKRIEVLAGGLVICLFGAAMGFGGTEPLSWAAVQLVAFLLCGLILWAEEACSRLPWKGPALLLAYVGLQTAVIRPEAYLVREQILRLLVYLCSFYLAAVVSRDQKSRAFLLRGLLALGLIEALYGLVQYVSGWQQIFAYKKFFYTSMATGTYINPNHFAGLLEMILPLSFASALSWFERLSRNAPHPQGLMSSFFKGEGAAALIFYLFSTLLLSAGIVFSRSRAGIFSACVSLAAVGLVWLSSTRQRPAAALVLLCLLVGTGLFGVWIGLGPVVERYETIREDYLSRLGVWKDSLALIRAHPLWGSGLGSFANVYTRVQSVLLTGRVDHAHNDYLEMATEWGLAGAGLLIGLILLVLFRAASACFRRSHPNQRFLALGSCGGILALLLHSVTDFNLQIPANALVFASILGLAHSASVSSTRGTMEEKQISAA